MFCKPNERVRNWKLADAARLYFGFKDNSKAAKNYITNLKKIEKKSAFAFIKDATHHSDELHLKRTTTLYKRLAKRLGVTDFLLFVDNLKYPILQANAFLFISDITAYNELVKLICTNLKLRTSKTRLLLILLEEYFDFISRTCNDLHGFIKQSQSYRQTSERNALRRQAKVEYKRSIEQLIPKSFDALLDLIFPPAALASSSYFLPFFEWINSHTKSNLGHHDTTPQKDVIDILN